MHYALWLDLDKIENKRLGIVTYIKYRALLSRDGFNESIFLAITLLLQQRKAIESFQFYMKYSADSCITSSLDLIMWKFALKMYTVFNQTAQTLVAISTQT